MAGYYGFTLVNLVSIFSSIFSFPGDNFRKYQWILTKLGRCIDIVEVCLGLLLGKFHHFLDRVICQLPHNRGWVLSFHVLFLFIYLHCLLPAVCCLNQLEVLFFTAEESQDVKTNSELSSLYSDKSPAKKKARRDDVDDHLQRFLFADSPENQGNFCGLT